MNLRLPVNKQNKKGRTIWEKKFWKRKLCQKSRNTVVTMEYVFGQNVIHLELMFLVDKLDL